MISFLTWAKPLIHDPEETIWNGLLAWTEECRQQVTGRAMAQRGSPKAGDCKTNHRQIRGEDWDQIWSKVSRKVSKGGRGGRGERKRKTWNPDLSWRRYHRENRVSNTNNHKQNLKGGCSEGGIYSRGKNREIWTKKRDLCWKSESLWAFWGQSQPFILFSGWRDGWIFLVWQKATEKACGQCLAQASLLVLLVRSKVNHWWFLQLENYFQYIMEWQNETKI